MMNMRENSRTDTVRDIDIVDMLLEWLSHWKSLMLCVVIMGIAFVGHIFINSDEYSTEAIETQTIQDRLEATLSVEEKEEAKDLEKLHLKYIDILKKYEENEQNYSPKERAEAAYYITLTKQSIEFQKKYLSEDQLLYYEVLLGFFDGETKVVEGNGSSIKYVVYAFLLILVHAVVCMGKYIVDGRVKVADNVGALLDCEELSRIIDWENINRKFILDRAIIKARLMSERKIDVEEAQEVASSTILDVAIKENMGSIVLLYGKQKKQADRIRELIQKEKSDLVVSQTSSVAYSSAGAKTASGKNGAALLVKIGETRISELLEEVIALRVRNIAIIGVIIYS